MTYSTPFIFAFFLSVFLTGFFRKAGFKLGLVAKPRKRDIHKKPVPRIGGLAIFISFLMLSLVYFLVVRDDLSFGEGKWFGVDKHMAAIWLGSLVIVASMFYDDIKALKAWQKLSFQIVAVIIIIASGIGIDTITNPFGNPIDLNSVYIPILTWNDIVYHFSFWSDLLTLIWIVGIMNILNFVDGVDGLAGGVSIIAALTIFMLSLAATVSQPQTAMIAIILAGSALGFLVWNFPPAKIFMGDTGSMFLGFILGVLTLISGGKLATVFLVMGFPIIDGLLVVGRRIRRRENPFTTPDKTHLHHRFLKAGFNSRQAVFALYIISAAFAWVALRSTTFNKLIAALILVALVVILTRILNYIIRIKSKTIRLDSR